MMNLGLIKIGGLIGINLNNRFTLHPSKQKRYGLIARLPKQVLIWPGSLSIRVIFIRGWGEDEKMRR